VLIAKQDGAITAVAVDGPRMVTGTAKGMVQMWQLSEGSPAKLLGSNSLHAGARISAIALSQDGERVAASDTAGRIAFWDVQSKRVHRTPPPGLTKRVFALHYHVATKQFMAISVVRGKNDTYTATVERWRPDGEVAAEPKPIDVGGRPIEAGAFAPNDGLLAVVTSSHHLLIPGPDRSTPILEQSFAGFATTLAFSPDGHRIAAAGQFEQIKIWEDMPERRFGHLIELDLKAMPGERSEDPANVTALAFSPDGRFIASAHKNDKVVLWDTKSPDKPQEHDGRPQLRGEPIKWISLLQMSPGETALVMPWDDGTIRRILVASGG
jgi:WD40 repeat protein